MKSLLLFFTATITIASTKQLSHVFNDTLLIKFNEFVKKYNIKYSSEQEKFVRYGIFLKNLDFIDHLNSHSARATFGITRSADGTFIEHNEIYRKYNISSRTNKCKIIAEVEDFKTDVLFDWRDKNVVSPVKDQGACGSCWAFSAIANLESVIAIKVGEIPDLSEQQIIDCDCYSDGCMGGFPDNAMLYMISRGIETEINYPYNATDGRCQYSLSFAYNAPKDCIALNVSEDNWAQKIQQMAPLVIALDSHILLHYQSGILSDLNCQGGHVDHAGVIVGFGEENGLKYWIVKNSWGEQWGENGYFRMQRGVDCLLVTQFLPTSAIL